MPGMAKDKKRDADRHKTPRKPVLYPADWLEVAHEMADADEKPTLWFLIGLIRKEATARGKTELPALPWERKKSP